MRWWVYGFSLWLVLSGDGDPVRFSEQATTAGLNFSHSSGAPEKEYILETIGSGVAWLDYDRDGWMDLYIVNGGRWEELISGRRTVSNALYRNRRDGTFEEVTETAGVAGTQWGMGATAADFDNDGWVDLFVANYGRDEFFRNQGDGTFEEISRRAGLHSQGWSSSGSFADFDGDGWLDLYIVRYVTFDHQSPPPPKCQYRGITVHCGPKGMAAASDQLLKNNRDGTFSDVSQQAGVVVKPAYGLAASWLDFDNDGDVDLFVANDSTPNFLFRNEKGRFRDIAPESGIAYSQDGNAQAGMGIATGDFDGDGLLDLYVTHFSDDYNTLYRNLGDTQFRDVSYPAQVAFPSWQYLAWGTFFFDYDNDGRADLFVANGHIYPQMDQFQIGTSFLQTNQVFRNLGNGKFLEVSADLGPALQARQSSRGAAYADYDNDGDLDIVVNNLDSRPSLLRNEGGHNSGNWLTLLLEPGSSRKTVVGARVEVSTGGLSQIQELQAGGSYQSSSDPRLHFGLGSNRSVDRITIRWPGGALQVIEEAAANQHYRVSPGSEPVAIKFDPKTDPSANRGEEGME